MVEEVKKNTKDYWQDTLVITGVIAFWILVIVIVVLLLSAFLGDDSNKQGNDRNGKSEEVCNTDTYGRGVDVEVCQPLPEYDY